MKKVIALQDLDCAVCASKMEEGVKNIDGITTASVNFLTQKMTLEYDENREEKILKEVKRVCRKIEPDCILKI